MMNDSDEKFLRLPQVLELIPIGKFTLWEKVKKGEFPRQIKLGTKTAGWRFSDVQAYMKSQRQVGEEVHHD